MHELTIATPLQDLFSAPREPPDAASAGLSMVPEGRNPDSTTSSRTMHSCNLARCHMCPIPPELIAGCCWLSCDLCELYRCIYVV